MLAYVAGQSFGEQMKKTKVVMFEGVYFNLSFSDFIHKTKDDRKCFV